MSLRIIDQTHSSEVIKAMCVSLLMLYEDQNILINDVRGVFEIYVAKKYLISDGQFSQQRFS